MSKSCHPISHLVGPIHPLPLPPKPRRRLRPRTPAVLCNPRTRTRASSPPSGGDLVPPQRLERKARRVQRSPRRLITISTSVDGRWHGQWSCDYVVSLGELELTDIAGEGQAGAKVLVTLSVQKHTGFGFSVGGRIITSFSRRCSSCLSPYTKEINTTFDVWVLPSSRSNPLQLPEIGGSDSSVIYVKPGSEADLDSLIRDTIRLEASAKDTCSESCENSTPIWNYTDGKRTYDRRWYRLLEIRKAYKDVLPG